MENPSNGYVMCMFQHCSAIVFPELQAVLIISFTISLLSASLTWKHSAVHHLDPGGDPGGPKGPGPPFSQDLFNIMQFWGNFRRKTLFWANFGLRAPQGQNSDGPPDQNPGSAPEYTRSLDPLKPEPSSHFESFLTRDTLTTGNFKEFR